MPTPEAEHIERVESIYHEALSLGAGHRAEFIADACDGNDALRREIEALLDAHSRADGFLETGALSMLGVPHDAVDTAADLVGLEIGHYRVTEFIASGGMGAVYRAERADGQFEQHVAVKLIKRGMDSDEVLNRFRNERQVLANLPHANIARLLDGGVSDDGRPFLVMEFVDGVRIDRFCDDHTLSIEDRIELFCRVCAAVGAAHRSLVVHRDLKPANILVGHDGEPKLLDFGIAKLLEHDVDSHATATGHRLMTPQYASPEQIRGEPITTASDVYSLGVILYELLTGHSPYRLNGIDLRGAVCTQEPARPSTAVAEPIELAVEGNTQTLSAVELSRRRAIGPERLRRRLSGDLDTILLTALRKDPERRYNSAEALADDLRRFLAGLPISAQRDTLGYRLRTFVRRNRLLVGAAAVVTATILAVTATAITFAIGQARALIEADAHAQIARSVNSFLNDDLLAAVAPTAGGEGLGRDVLMLDVLDAASERIERAVTPGGRFDGNERIEASIRHTLGETYRRLGEWDKSEHHLVRALELLEELEGVDHTDTLRVARQLGVLRREQDRTDDAEALAERVLQARRRADGDQHQLTLQSIDELGQVRWAQGRYDEAETLYQEALDGQERTLGTEHRDTLTTLGNLALLYSDTGRLEEAERLYLAVLDTERRVLGNEDPSTLTSMSNLAMLYEHLGRYDDAETLHREALGIRESILGPRHPSTLVSMNAVGVVLRDQGHLQQAEAWLLNVLELRRAVLGDDCDQTQTTISSLAQVYRRQGHYDAAEPLYIEVLDYRRHTLGERHKSTLLSMNNLGVLYNNMDRFEDAARVLNESLTLHRDVLGRDHPQTDVVIGNLALSLSGLGRYDEAEPLYVEGLESDRRRFGDDHRSTLIAMYNLGRFYYDTERYADAEPLLLVCTDKARLTLPEGHWFTGVFLGALGAVHLARNDLEAAERALLDAHSILDAALGTGHERTAKVAEKLVALYELREQPADAAAWQERMPATDDR